MDNKRKIEANEDLKIEHFNKKPKIELKGDIEFQTGMAVLEKKDKTVFNEKYKIECKDNLQFQTGMAVLENMDNTVFKKELETDGKKPEIEFKDSMEFQTGMPVPKNFDFKVKSEPRDELELQAGLSAFNQIDHSFFNQKPKFESFDIKPKIEVKKESEDKDLQAGLSVLQKELTWKEIELKFGCNACDSHFQNLRELAVHA